MSDEATSAAAMRRLRELEQALAGSPRVWILMHDTPDPDCLSAALAILGVLKERLALQCAITYGGVIGRADNRAMVEMLAIPLWHIESITPRPEDRFLCVDTQPAFTNHSLPDGATVAAVLDHHPMAAESHFPFVDLRPGCGSVAAMAVDYVLAAGLPFTAPLATAIAFGILSETQDLAREAGPADLAAYAQVLPMVDHVLLGRLRHPEVERPFFDTLAVALRAARLCHDVVICHLQHINAPDEAARVADILNALAGSDWVLCTGRYRDSLFISLRTSDNSANAGRVLGRAVKGRGGSGGHGMMAGGRVPLADGADPDEVRRAITTSLLAALGLDGDAPLEPLLSPSRPEVWTRWRVDAAPTREDRHG